MNEKIEALKEALTFIRENWMGTAALWRGEPHELVGATAFGGVTKIDIKRIVEASIEGEPVPIEGISGTIKAGRLIEVVVSK